MAGSGIFEVAPHRQLRHRSIHCVTVYANIESISNANIESIHCNTVYANIESVYGDQ